MELIIAYGREGIIVYKCSISHPSNIKTWTPIVLLPIHLKLPMVHKLWIFEANFNIKQLKKCNPWATYYFRAFHV